MHPRTEILLYQLAWSLDKLLRPTWRNLESSFESWSYGNGLLRQIQRLEAQAMIETRRDEQTGKRVVRLTAKGLAAGQLVGDPEHRWHRDWDGKWRVILFDLPEEARAARSRLRRKLQAASFGCLQRSVWISPDSLDGVAKELRALAVDAANLVLLDATPCGGESPTDMVAAAWDFLPIDQAWQNLESHLDAAPDLTSAKREEPHVRWVAKERELLRHCFRLDPVLPRELHPAGYRGMEVWKKRRKVLSQLARNSA